ncbi:NUDIX hydrolase [Shimia biformata]|uniref:NUDIX hydrolase n=1 Tax=Shimia biformata TaxID=1294299 RepID=UPI00194EF0B8|nr:NUDIX hydrolase [Shimia biformata]
MTEALKDALASVVGPLLRRPKRVQVAALCYRERKGDKQVLLVTSKDTKRWIVPKGWPIDGLDAAGAALQEAWEEAGVRKANISDKPLGSFHYDKRLDGGAPMPVEAQVFGVEVKKLEDEFPEAEDRTRKWVSPEKAAEMVDEPELQSLLRQI